MTFEAFSLKNRIQRSIRLSEHGKWGYNIEVGIKFRLLETPFGFQKKMQNYRRKDATIR